MSGYGASTPAGIIDRQRSREGERTVVFVAAVGEVHAHHVQTRLAEFVNGLHGVGFGADGADDGSPAQVALRLVGRVKLRKPFDLAAERKMVESGRRHCDGLTRCGRSGWCLRKFRARLRIQRGCGNLSLAGLVSNLRLRR